jgi:hypothetical protein
MHAKRPLMSALATALLMLHTVSAFAQGGNSKAGAPARAEPAAKPAFNKSAVPVPGRPRPIRLPYKANPIPQQRSAARTLNMAEQIRAKTNKNRIRISGNNGRQMVMDVGARRPSGERHFDKSTGKVARLPHVRNDRIVTDVATNGKRFPRRVKGATHEATIQELRTTRRFVESQARARAALRRAPRPAR